MADEVKKSPAVISMEREQAERRDREEKGDLDTALEDTFPASDPVSMTFTGIPAGRTDTDRAAHVRANADAYPANVAVLEKDAKTLVTDLGRFVKQNPLTVAGFVAAVAFVYGATR